MTSTKDDSVIDNEVTYMVDKLHEILPRATRVSIAVGYFFISGFAQIMDHIQKIEESDDPSSVIRLLISPTTNRPTAEALLAAHEYPESVKKRFQVERLEYDKAKKDIRETLEYMEQSPENGVVARRLIELIHKKKLQVKVYTRTRLHAKAYIFELDDPIVPKISIVGSSNLSVYGIRDHAELNIKTKENYYSDRLLDWFEKHWNDEESIEFTEDVADLLESSWAGKMYTTKDVYEKAAVYEYGHPPEFDNRLEGSEKLYDFQKIAVIDAIKKMDRYGGVIIADVVGTGKSYIGSVILKYLQETRRSGVLIICPPHLQDMWKSYLREFGIRGAAVVSRHKVGADKNILEDYYNYDAILVDESHNFRNSNTRQYENLLKFMEEHADDSSMIMLTATPISNSIHDLKNQLMLFPADMLSRVDVLAGTTLDEYFKGKEDSSTRRVSSEGASKIRELLRYVLIRRTRVQIMEKYGRFDGRRYYLEKDGERNYFPDRMLENPKEYDPDKVYNNAFDDIEGIISSLKLARYAPGNYLLEEYKDKYPYDKLLRTTVPLVGIVKTTLLKRMESSIKAFASSVDNYLNGSKAFRDQLDGDRVPIGDNFPDLIYEKITMGHDMDDDEFDRKMANVESKYDIKAFDVKRWRRDISDDIARFSSMRGMLVDESKFTKVDDKLHTLLDIVRREGNEKILIFSESAVTARYIHDYLTEKIPEKRDRIGYVDSKVSTKEKYLMAKRFDPKHNQSVKPDPRQSELEILVSTDVLSEGINLQSGRTVINYDFHWNPVRLIQRVGRVDRIGSEHDAIRIVNFLPTRKIDAKLSLRERVAAKIETFRSIIGTNNQILEATEVIDEDAVKDIYAKNEEVLESNIGKKINREINSILDTEELQSEAVAAQIKDDVERLARIESIPFGIRSWSAPGKLLMACEADDKIFRDGEIISSATFKKYYEVTSESIKRIWASSFLKQAGDGASADRQIATPPPKYRI